MSNDTSPGQTAATTFSVPGVSCDHCKSAIESSVGAVDAVTSVEVDVDAKSVTVVGGRDADVVAAIEAAGYEVA